MITFTCRQFGVFRAHTRGRRIELSRAELNAQPAEAQPRRVTTRGGCLAAAPACLVRIVILGYNQGSVGSIPCLTTCFWDGAGLGQHWGNRPTGTTVPTTSLGTGYRYGLLVTGRWTLKSPTTGLRRGRAGEELVARQPLDLVAAAVAAVAVAAVAKGWFRPFVKTKEDGQPNRER